MYSLVVNGGKESIGGVMKFLKKEKKSQTLSLAFQYVINR
jgi:hypothetical protein